MSVNNSSPGIRLAVKVTPNAGRNEITSFKDGVLHVKVSAAPEKGKANKELVDFLAEKLGIRKSSIFIVKGQASRHKALLIKGTNSDALLKFFKT